MPQFPNGNRKTAASFPGFALSEAELLDNWYAFFVKTGYEDEVCRMIDALMRESEGAPEYELMVPKRRLIEHRLGADREVTKPFFPGYVLVNTEDPYVLKRIARTSTKFYALLSDLADSGAAPIKVYDAVKFLYLLDDDGVAGISSVFLEGQRVYALSGPLTRYSGVVKKINRRRGRAKVSFMFDGRERTFDLAVSILAPEEVGEDVARQAWSIDFERKTRLEDAPGRRTGGSANGDIQG